MSFTEVPAGKCLMNRSVMTVAESAAVAMPARTANASGARHNNDNANARTRTSAHQKAAATHDNHANDDPDQHATDTTGSVTITVASPGSMACRERDNAMNW
jgi:hypothetical protein